MRLYEALDILNEASVSGIANTMSNLLTRVKNAKSPEEELDPIKQLARIAPNPNEPLKISQKYGSGEVAQLKEPYSKINQFFTQNAERLKKIPMDVEGASNAYEALKNTLTAVYNVINAGGESYTQQSKVTNRPLGGKPLAGQGQQRPATSQTPIR